VSSYTELKVDHVRPSKAETLERRQGLAEEHLYECVEARNAIRGVLEMHCTHAGLNIWMRNLVEL
jgi:hypothetical protein